MVKVWNKQDSINGIEANEILSKRPDLQFEQNVILITDNSGRVTNIELCSILRQMLSLDESVNAEEVGESYAQYIKQRDQTNQANMDSVVANAEQITSLGQSLAQEKLEKIQLSAIVNSLGAELSQVKLQLIQQSI